MPFDGPRWSSDSRQDASSYPGLEASWDYPVFIDKDIYGGGGWIYKSSCVSLSMGMYPGTFYTKWLVGRGFSFEVPEDQVVTQIIIEVAAYNGRGTSGDIGNNAYIDGAICGYGTPSGLLESNKDILLPALTNDAGPHNFTTLTISPGSLTQSQINSAIFYVALRFRMENGYINAETVHVYEMRVTVVYGDGGQSSQQALINFLA